LGDLKKKKKEKIARTLKKNDSLQPEMIFIKY